ncbi:transposase [Streptomyces sp. NPDC056638]|uniref:transposase n=1 Tax=Streptomyces sp. NPDC056638 TaxID=3345887 RepID=UPI003674493A
MDLTINELLRCSDRERAGRSEDPSPVVLDTQSVHAAVNLPAATTGKGAAKRVPGRERGIAVDVLGLVIAVVVVAASAQDNEAGIALLDTVAERAPSTVRALVDQGFEQSVVQHGRSMGVDVEIVERNPQDFGFAPQPMRWRVEQTFGVLMLHRRGSCRATSPGRSHPAPSNDLCGDAPSCTWCRPVPSASSTALPTRTRPPGGAPRVALTVSRTCGWTDWATARGSCDRGEVRSEPGEEARWRRPSPMWASGSGCWRSLGSSAENLRCAIALCHVTWFTRGQ